MPDPVPFPAAVQELLDQPLVAHISTLSPSGVPQSSVVWFERRGTELVMFSGAESPKVRNLKENPAVVVIVVDPEQTVMPGAPAYVRLTGTGEVHPAEEGIEHRLAKRYGQPNGYPDPLGEIVNIHITVRDVSGVGPFPGESWVPEDGSQP
jgi:PPOX class probable F420-dependent enzyme